MFLLQLCFGGFAPLAAFVLLIKEGHTIEKQNNKRCAKNINKQFHKITVWIFPQIQIIVA